jgi:ligand-binding sensor domain-containing protein
MPVNIIYIDRRNRDILYAGTDIGVFRSDTAGESWEPFDNGMPPVVVTSFTTTADGRLIVGTYGRGVYELALGEPPQAGPRRRSVRH